jgi:hypothetical protein
LHETLVGVFQEPPGGLHAQLQEVVAGRGAEFLPEHPREVPGAHRHAVGERVDPTVAGRDVPSSTLVLVHRLRVRGLRFE